ncbi:MAG: tetratricopeptide repeat protein, partial [candidate division Zixibacteria bacterium]|nr:tetratricopeptide repeat protein [candidate division Zixibacteria bacterium]
LEKDGDPVGAVANYRAALKRYPTHPEACYRLALINYANKHFERAGLLLDRALKSDPANHLIHYQLGLAFDRVSEPDSAVSYLRRAVELEPEFDKAAYSLGLLWLNQQQPDSAVKYLDQYLKLVDDDSPQAGEVRELIESIQYER